MLYDLDSYIERFGIDAELHVSFIEENNNKMSVLIASVSIGNLPSIDYSLCLDTTLAEIIKDLLDRC